MECNQQRWQIGDAITAARLTLLLLLLSIRGGAAEMTLEFLELDSSLAAISGSVSPGTNSYSDPISIALPSGGGFPFSNTTESVIYVSSNGFLSFRTGRETCCSDSFNSTSPYTHVIAPYWTHNDITTTGEVVYEVHVNGSQLERVSLAVSEKEGVAFEGTWMLVVYWNDVPAYQSTQRNSYQAVLVTDGLRSYAVFLYHCDSLETLDAGIGYFASGNFFENYPLSNSGQSADIACVNKPKSPWSTVIYNIHYDGVRAAIRSRPEGPVFQAAAYIDLTCHVVTPGTYTFAWVGYCTQGETETIVSNHPGYTDASSILSLRSTPDTCLDEVACRASDDQGTHTEQRFRLTNVTGVGMYNEVHSMSNNTGLEADAQHQIGQISCHSASREPNIGRWIAPNGDDITFSADDNFVVDFHSGDFPSYSVLSLLPGAEFSASLQGVYSCVIPDEFGVEQTLNFGLYDTDYAVPANPLSMERTSEQPFTLTCASTHLPSFLQRWWKIEDSVTVAIGSEDTSYTIASTLRDRYSSAYANTLTIVPETGIDPVGHIYTCGIGMILQQYQQQSNPTLASLQAYYSHAVVNQVGVDLVVSCRAGNSPATTKWAVGGIEVTSAEGNFVELVLDPVNDAHHQQEFICSGYSNAGALVYRLSTIVIVQVPSLALEVSVPQTAAPVLGQPHTAQCLARKTLDGLTNHATAEWSHDRDVTADPENTDSPLLTYRNLHFPELRTSHAGQYACEGSLLSPALDEPLAGTADYDITLTLPVATVSLTTPPAVSPFHAGSNLTLTCTATLSPAIDTEVIGVVAWDTPHGMLTESTDRLTLSGMQTDSHTHQFTLNIFPVSHLIGESDEGEYGCSVMLRPASPTPHVLPSPQSVSNAVQLSLSGAGLYHYSRGHLQNNSVLTAGEDGSIGTVLCISDSPLPNVGQWITPLADDSQVLDISFGGETDPGVVRLALSEGSVFSAELQGIYSCITEDESGERHTLNIGIYPHGFNTPVSVSVVSVSRESSRFTVECTTFHSPPSLLSWIKDNQPLDPASPQLTFSQRQEVTGRGRSSYSSWLVVEVEEEAVDLVIGTYRCSAENDFGSSAMELLVSGIEITGTASGVFVLGQPASLTCTSDLTVDSIQWSLPGEAPGSVAPQASSEQSSSLEFAVVSEDMQDMVYVCHVTTPYGELERETRMRVEAEPSDFQISVTSSSEQQTVAVPYTLTCSYSTPAGLRGVPDLQWLKEDGQVVANTSDISVTSLVAVEGNHGRVINLVLHFRALSHDHAGRYMCRANVSIAVPPFQITRSGAETITPVDLPSPPKNIFPLSITTVSATIQWSTGDNQYLVSALEYRLDYALTSSLEGGHTVTASPDATSEDRVSVTLHGLLPGTRYYYQVTAITAVGSEPSGLQSFITTDEVTVTPAPQQDNGGVIGSVVAILLVIIVVVAITTGVTFWSLRRKRNRQIHTMNGDIPPYQQAPPPYTTNSSFTTNSHHYCDSSLSANGNAEYAIVGNGHYSHVAVDNGMYESIPPRLPPMRNSSQDPDPIQPYAESDVGELKKSQQGQSTHRIETANPLYATTDSLEHYSKATSDDDSLETGGDVDEKVSYYNT